ESAGRVELWCRRCGIEDLTVLALHAAPGLQWGGGEAGPAPPGAEALREAAEALGDRCEPGDTCVLHLAGLGALCEAGGSSPLIGAYFLGRLASRVAVVCMADSARGLRLLDAEDSDGVLRAKQLRVAFLALGAPGTAAASSAVAGPQLGLPATATMRTAAELSLDEGPCFLTCGDFLSQMGEQAQDMAVAAGVPPLEVHLRSHPDDQTVGQMRWPIAMAPKNNAKSSEPAAGTTPATATALPARAVSRRRYTSAAPAPATVPAEACRSPARAGSLQPAPRGGTGGRRAPGGPPRREVPGTPSSPLGRPERQQPQRQQPSRPRSSPPPAVASERGEGLPALGAAAAGEAAVGPPGASSAEAAEADEEGASGATSAGIPGCEGLAVFRSALGGDDAAMSVVDGSWELLPDDAGDADDAAVAPAPTGGVAAGLAQEEAPAPASAAAAPPAKSAGRARSAAQAPQEAAPAAAAAERRRGGRPERHGAAGPPPHSQSRRRAPPTSIGAFSLMMTGGGLKDQEQPGAHLRQRGARSKPHRAGAQRSQQQAPSVAAAAPTASPSRAADSDGEDSCVE
ncbi:unnamed protein product, partial [Prorocentrum cordatum]